MNNPFKNNPLASGLLGFILGAGTLAGGQALFGGGGNDAVASGFGNFSSGGMVKTETVYEQLDNHADGDVFVTKAGKCYHPNRYCSSLRRAKEVKQVYRSDAENVGLTPCSKCF